jgi:hypothetical protein
VAPLSCPKFAGAIAIVRTLALYRRENRPASRFRLSHLVHVPAVRALIVEIFMAQKRPTQKDGCGNFTQNSIGSSAQENEGASNFVAAPEFQYIETPLVIDNQTKQVIDLAA